MSVFPVPRLNPECLIDMSLLLSNQDPVYKHFNRLLALFREAINTKELVIIIRPPTLNARWRNTSSPMIVPELS